MHFLTNKSRLSYRVNSLDLSTLTFHFCLYNWTLHDSKNTKNRLLVYNKQIVINTFDQTHSNF